MAGVLRACLTKVPCEDVPVIETADVSGLRRLRFDSLDDVLVEARALAVRPTRQLGNWSLGQVCRHLGTAMEQCTTAEQLFSVPLRLRIVGRLIRRHVLKRGLPRGFKLPPEGAAVLVPPPTSVELGLMALEQGVEALRRSSRRVPHPVLGAMNVDQWNQFHLRHAEMHLGFIVAE